MNSFTNEIKENFPEYDQFVAWFNQHTYTNTSLENCQRWELREALSYYLTKPADERTIKEITKSIVNQQEKSWNKLTIVQEAELQFSLRDHGIEVLGENIWPTDSIGFKQIIKKLSIKTTLKYKTIDKFLKFLYSIDLSWANKYKTLICYLVLVTLFFDSKLLLLGLLLGFLLWIPADIIRHDYVEHNYLTPKNKYIRYFIELYIQWLVPSTYHDRQGMVEHHKVHHRYWKTDKDIFTKRVEQEFIPGLQDYDISFIRKPDAVNDVNVPYLIETKLLVFVCVALVYGIANAVFLVLLPYTIVNVLNFQHDWYFFKFGEKNYPWLFPLTLNQSWHLDHHKKFKKIPDNWDRTFNGPRWVRYINPQYYFARLIFRLT